MLTGYTFCLLLETKKTATKVVQVYVDEIHAQSGGSVILLSHSGTEFKNQQFTAMARV